MSTIVLQSYKTTNYLWNSSRFILWAISPFYSVIDYFISPLPPQNIAYMQVTQLPFMYRPMICSRREWIISWNNGGFVTALTVGCGGFDGAFRGGNLAVICTLLCTNISTICFNVARPVATLVKPVLHIERLPWSVTVLVFGGPYLGNIVQFHVFFGQVHVPN